MVVFWGAVLVLLVPAVLLSVDRLVEPDRGFWIRLEAFTPWAMVLYAGVLLLVLLRLLAIRRWRSAATAVALVAAAGLAVHLWWFSPQVTGSNPPPAAGAETLTVMTANLLEGGADGVEVVQVASEERVGLLVVEEVTSAVLADMERAGLDELFPYRIGEPRGATDGTMAFARMEISCAAGHPDPPPGLGLHPGRPAGGGRAPVLADRPGRLA